MSYFQLRGSRLFHHSQNGTLRVFPLSRLASEIESETEKVYRSFENSSAKVDIDPSAQALEEIVSIHYVRHGVLGYYEIGDWFRGTPVLRYVTYAACLKSGKPSEAFLVGDTFNFGVAAKPTFSRSSFWQSPATKQIFFASLVTLEHNPTAFLPCISLGAYFFDEQKNVIMTVATTIKQTTPTEYCELPVPLNKQAREFSSTHWVEKHSRVFAIVSVLEKKPCLWVHAFFRRSFVTVVNKHTFQSGLFRFKPFDTLLEADWCHPSSAIFRCGQRARFGPSDVEYFVSRLCVDF